MRLDHFAWACSSLEKGVEEFIRLGGPRAEFGGSHTGQGTCNAVASLGPGIYLAIDAPDEAQDQKGTYGEVLSQLKGFDLNVFAIACDDLLAPQKRLRSLGIDSTIVRKSRVRPDGVELKSSVIEMAEHGYGKFMPHFMQWHTDDHPSLSTPEGCNFVSFVVEHPNADELAAFYQRFGLDIVVERASTSRLRVTLSGAKGNFELPT